MPFKFKPSLAVGPAFHKVQMQVPQTLTLYIGSFLRVFSNSQGGSLLLLSSSQQVSHTLVIDLQEAAGTEG